MNHYRFIEEPSLNALFDAFRMIPVLFSLEDSDNGDRKTVIVTRLTALQHGDACSTHFTGYLKDGSVITGTVKGEGSSGERSYATINP